jgi:DNA end-binding protein Ku
MPGRPFWSGQLKISLVSFGIQLFPATNSQSGISFHQIDRASGERVRHLNVIGDDEPVDNADIVKGYEYSKDKYLVVEPEEIAKLRIETKNVIEVNQFVDLNELSPVIFEKPYFVVPEPKESVDAFAVICKAMEQTKKAAIGELVFGGREHLVAIAVPPDKSGLGMMAYVLRYRDELRESEEYFQPMDEAQKQGLDKKQLAMATELIKAYSSPFHFNSFRDDYEDALRELIEAKQKNVPLPTEEKRPKATKIVNLMDALRKSVSQANQPSADKKNLTKTPPKKGPVLVGVSKRKHRAA